MKDALRGLSKRGSVAALDPQIIATQALTFLACDPGRAAAFLEATGVTPDSLRRAATDPGFLEGVLDFLMSDETLLIEAAAHIGIPPQALAAAHAELGRT